MELGSESQLEKESAMAKFDIDLSRKEERRWRDRAEKAERRRQRRIYSVCFVLHTSISLSCQKGS